MPEKKKTSLRDTLGKRLKMTREVAGGSAAVPSALSEAQERGDDYSAKVHVPATSEKSLAATQAETARLKADQQARWDAEEDVPVRKDSEGKWVFKKQTGYYQQFGKPHPKKGY